LSSLAAAEVVALVAVAALVDTAAQYREKTRGPTAQRKARYR
jgi:hypothetical protein